MKVKGHKIGPGVNLKKADLRGADLRGAISGIVNQQKATLLSMQAKHTSLEDIFRELTK